MWYALTTHNTSYYAISCMCKMIFNNTMSLCVVLRSLIIRWPNIGDWGTQSSDHQPVTWWLSPSNLSVCRTVRWLIRAAFANSVIWFGVSRSDERSLLAPASTSPDTDRQSQPVARYIGAVPVMRRRTSRQHELHHHRHVYDIYCSHCRRTLVTERLQVRFIRLTYHSTWCTVLQQLFVVVHR